ncbi:MAG TPA: lysylphosphatidylglycerol synthase transmembrane domain-containing protein [Candidatus Nanoarchaeia archaeon]
MFGFSRSKIISYLILIIAILSAIYLVRGQRDTLSKIFEINIFQFSIISLIVLLTPLADGLRTMLLTKQFGVNLTVKESFALSSVNNFWNYLPFTGGIIVRSVYLKKKHGFSYTNFISTVAASYIISFLSFGLVGLVSVLIIWQTKGFANLWVVSIFLLSVLFSLTMIKINLKFNIKFLSLLSKVFSGWKILRERKSLLINLMLLDFVLILVFAIRLSLAAQFLGTPLPFLGILVIVSLSLFAVLLNVTPGALVVKEAIISFGAAALSYNPYEGFTISLLDRAVSMVWIFLLGVIFSYYLTSSRQVNKGKSKSVV